ncbi:MAG: HalD/BesD family halogenase [Thiolinea sp.]
MTNQNHNPAEMVNLEHYPITDLTSVTGAAFARASREEYEKTGLCMLPDFILPSALTALADEANDCTGDAYFCKSSHNAYLTDDDSGLAKDDIARRQEQTFVGSVPYDRIDRQSRLNALYEWDALKDFIAYVLDKDTFHRFADPFGACSINVFVDGGEHGWHFDESEFTVTLMLQPPEKGGTFEYLPLIRGLENEKELVAGVLDGKRDGVVELPFTAGTLLIFGGRQTIHRVTRVEGERPRLVPVLCYSETPNLQNSETVRQLFWGRRGPDDEPISNGSVVAA